MPTRGLRADVKISIDLGCIMSRNRYTTDPGPVIAELFATAGRRTDLLAHEMGSWVAYYGDDYTRTLSDALLALPLDIRAGIAHGEEARNRGTHSTVGTGGPDRERRNAPTLPKEDGGVDLRD